MSGLGMGVLTFDWNQISYIGSPLMVPWWAEVHIFVGFVFFYWILCPLMYYNNVSLLRLSPVRPGCKKYAFIIRCGAWHTSPCRATVRSTTWASRTT